MRDYGNLLPNYFEDKAPLEFIEYITGRNATLEEIEIVQGLRFKYQIPDEVLNVLFDYIINFKKKNLATKYTELYLNKLVNANAFNAGDAMSFFRNEEFESSSKKEAIVAEKEDEAKLNLLLDQAVFSLKNRCSTKQKQALLQIMNDMIRSSRSKE